MGVDMALEFDKYCVVDRSPNTVLPSPRHSKAEKRKVKWKPICENEELSQNKDFTEINFNRYRSASCRTVPSRSEGRRVFNEMIEKNVVTWTAMISGLAQNQFYEESLALFLEMQRGLVAPNALTYLSLLVACSSLQALKEGCQIHGHVWKRGMQSDLCMESALMDLYSKCGSVEDTWKIFESAQVHDEGC